MHVSKMRNFFYYAPKIICPKHYMSPLATPTFITPPKSSISVAPERAEATTWLVASVTPLEAKESSCNARDSLAALTY